MKNFVPGARGRSRGMVVAAALTLTASFLLMLSCTRAPQPGQAPSRPSDIKVEVRDGGPVVLTTSAAEFEILPSGFLQAFLLKDGKKLTLDEPGVGSAAGSDYLVSEGKELHLSLIHI